MGTLAASHVGSHCSEQRQDQAWNWRRELRTKSDTFSGTDQRICPKELKESNEHEYEVRVLAGPLLLTRTVCSLGSIAAQPRSRESFSTARWIISQQHSVAPKSHNLGLYIHSGEAGTCCPARGAEGKRGTELCTLDSCGLYRVQRSRRGIAALRDEGFDILDKQQDLVHPYGVHCGQAELSPSLCQERTPIMMLRPQQALFNTSKPHPSRTPDPPQIWDPPHSPDLRASWRRSSDLAGSSVAAAHAAVGEDPSGTKGTLHSVRKREIEAQSRQAPPAAAKAVGSQGLAVRRQRHLVCFNNTNSIKRRPFYYIRKLNAEEESSLCEATSHLSTHPTTTTTTTYAPQETARMSQGSSPSSSRSGSRSRPKSPLSIDLSCIPPLVQPTPPSNTLIITNLQDPAVFHPENIQILKDLINGAAPIHSWAPLRSFSRIIVSFFEEQSAIRVRQILDGETILGQRVKIYFGHQTPIEPKDEHLHLPDAGKLFFISPPPSPPHGWEVKMEDAPNKQVHAEDLAEALAKLHHRPNPNLPASPISDGEQEGRTRSGSTTIYDPSDHGCSPNLPAISVSVMGEEEISPLTAEKPLLAHTARPPVELMET
ncbi:uncharacterized protein BP5553_00305 [Venustampulla echinocandica]|uniref:Uncharacterized protein n=1 Tax=Venustampulla echinocandica TaxID=2656787 RepID=A0A370TXR6_9HELO|nr:uncharacterized protein BP5553_00305 [Venustampulla echinocandica]RDL40326.1 hypothetical protein BP5553_00305 [Venustampulla echinocandica]